MATVQCPAGEAIGEAWERTPDGPAPTPACRCRIEQKVISPVTEPSTYIGHCTKRDDRPVAIFYALVEGRLRVLDGPGQAVRLMRQGIRVHRADRHGYTDCHTWRTEKARRFVKPLAADGGDWWTINASGRMEYSEPVETYGEGIESKREAYGQFLAGVA